MQSNTYGLSRHIPSPVMREVRQRCGFGCVVCGNAIYDFEHFDPDFKDATAHVASGITLLCPTCNQKKARGWLPVEKVTLANASPFCLTKGFASEVFDFLPGPINFIAGSVGLVNLGCALMIKGIPVVSFSPPETPGEPVRMSANLTDESGRPLLLILDNKWSVPNENWDVECSGGHLKVRSAPRDILLHIHFQPPHTITIVRARLWYKGDRADIGDDGIQITHASGGQSGFHGITIVGDGTIGGIRF